MNEDSKVVIKSRKLKETKYNGQKKTDKQYSAKHSIEN